MQINTIIITILTTIGAQAMAVDTYSIAIKETQFDEKGPVEAREIAVDWNSATLSADKNFTIKTVTYHHASAGGMDLVRIVLGSDVGDLTTTQSFLTHMVSRPHSGPISNGDLSAAIRVLAIATLPNVTGTFTFEREEDGTKRFRCSAPNERLVGIYFNGKVAVAQIKPTEAADNSEGNKVEVNKTWFSIIGVNKMNNP